MENVGDLLEEALSVCHDSETSPSPSKKAKANHQSPQVNKSSCIHLLGFSVFYAFSIFLFLDQKFE